MRVSRDFWGNNTEILYFHSNKNISVLILEDESKVLMSVSKSGLHLQLSQYRGYMIITRPPAPNSNLVARVLFVYLDLINVFSGCSLRPRPRHWKNREVHSHWALEEQRAASGPSGTSSKGESGEVRIIPHHTDTGGWLELSSCLGCLFCIHELRRIFNCSVVEENVWSSLHSWQLHSVTPPLNYCFVLHTYVFSSANRHFFQLIFVVNQIKVKRDHETVFRCRKFPFSAKKSRNSFQINLNVIWVFPYWNHILNAEFNLEAV